MELAGYEPGVQWPPPGWPPHFYATEWNCLDHRGLLGPRGEVVGDVEKAPKEIYEAVRRCAWNLERVREITGPLRVTSGWRPSAFNKALRDDSLRRNGGTTGVAKYSEHIPGRAADVVPLERGVTVARVHAVIIGLIREGRIEDGGVGIYSSWVHYDCRCAFGKKPWRGDYR